MNIQKIFDIDQVYRYALRDLNDLCTPDQVDQDTLEYAKFLVCESLVYEEAKNRRPGYFHTKIMHEAYLASFLKPLLLKRQKEIKDLELRNEKRRHLTLVK